MAGIDLESVILSEDSATEKELTFGKNRRENEQAH